MLLAGYFLIWGGEYSWSDLKALRAQESRTIAAIDSLKRLNDSLVVELQAIRTDPREQERVAREKYGMLRPGEFLYRIEFGVSDSGKP